MATITTPPLAPAPADPSRDGVGEWRAGWRVALRLARRDVRRHVGRSLLIVIMVAVPVLLLVGGNIVFSSQDLTAAERIPYAMGQTQAVATYSLRYQDSLLEADFDHVRRSPIDIIARLPWC